MNNNNYYRVFPQVIYLSPAFSIFQYQHWNIHAFVIRQTDNHIVRFFEKSYRQKKIRP